MFNRSADVDTDLAVKTRSGRDRHGILQEELDKGGVWYDNKFVTVIKWSKNKQIITTGRKDV